MNEYNTVAKRIKQRRAELGLTLEQVGDRVGVGKSTVRKWETGMIATIRGDKIAALAEALATTPADLMGWDENGAEYELSDDFAADAGDAADRRTIPLPPGARPVRRRRLPLLGNVACGEPIFTDQGETSYITTESEDGEGIAIDADYCLYASGDSMINARIFDGDLLFIRKQDIVDNGEIALVLVEDSATVKRVFYDRENNIITLMPENPLYRPMRFVGEELDHIRILGKVVGGQYLI